MNKYLVVGLGNIGDEYKNTRHNIGFDILDGLANEANLGWKTDRLALVSELKFKGRTLILIKPTTFMNLSGKAVQYWMNIENILLENILIVADELALPFGKMKLNPKGSDGGHNGLKSVQEHLATSNYCRLRFGIGNELGKGYNANYVLGEWNDEEKKTLPARVKVACDGIKSFSFIGLARTANSLNIKNK